MKPPRRPTSDPPPSTPPVANRGLCLDGWLLTARALDLRIRAGPRGLRGRVRYSSEASAVITKDIAACSTHTADQLSPPAPIHFAW